MVARRRVASVPAWRATSRLEATPALRRDRADHRDTVAEVRDHRCHPRTAASARATSRAGHESEDTNAIPGSATTAASPAANARVPRRHATPAPKTRTTSRNNDATFMTTLLPVAVAGGEIEVGGYAAEVAKGGPELLDAALGVGEVSAQLVQCADREVQALIGVSALVVAQPATVAVVGGLEGEDVGQVGEGAQRRRHLAGQVGHVGGVRGGVGLYGRHQPPPPRRGLRGRQRRTGHSGLAQDATPSTSTVGQATPQASATRCCGS